MSDNIVFQLAPLLLAVAWCPLDLYLLSAVVSCRFKVHKNGNASEVLKSIAHMDNSNKQCKFT